MDIYVFQYLIFLSASAQPAERDSPAPVRVKPEKKKAAPKQNTKKLQPQGANKRKSWRGDDGIEVINLSDSDSEAIVKKEVRNLLYALPDLTEHVDLEKARQKRDHRGDRPLGSMSLHSRSHPSLYNS